MAMWPQYEASRQSDILKKVWLLGQGGAFGSSPEASWVVKWLAAADTVFSPVSADRQFPFYRITVSFKAFPSSLWESSDVGRLYTHAQQQAGVGCSALLSGRASDALGSTTPPPSHSQAVGLWGFAVVQGRGESKCVGCVAVEHSFGDGLGVITVALTLILYHFITCPEEAKFVSRISHIPYQTLTYSFWPYFLSL